MTQPPSRPRVLILADDCNPEWPSLPIVGYKYARALSRICDVTLATHVRNRENIEKRGGDGMTLVYLDNEYIARPLYKLATRLRGGDEVAWSTSMIMAYLPYLAFEREAWKRFRGELTAGAFDIVHRITPMTPTLPSWIAGRGKAAFVIGPLNGNLAWPAFFAEEQAREREGLRRLRDLYKVLPYARSTYRKADAVLAAFRHTVDDLDAADPAKIVIFPEVGYDEEIFHPGDRAAADPADPDAGRTRFLFVGRMVPYKMPEVLVRAMAASPTLQRHLLHFVGDGPETPRLKALVEAHGLQDCVRFEGRRTQAEVADWMRRADVFAFPSIRELGAGVVVEAMACGMINLVVDYGAPGALVRDDRGLRVPLGPMEALVEGFRTGMERCVAMPPEERAAMRAAACAYAEAKLRWPAKAEATMEVYRAVLSGAPMPDVYGAGAD